MSDSTYETPISTARGQLAEVANRAAYAGAVTFLTRNGKRCGAAIVPEQLLADYERLLDAEEDQIAFKRAAEIHAGIVTPIPLEEVGRRLHLEE
ncbi:MAG: hypothetical protein ACREP9_08335 [Candidatus Dormibacteraceae bacterium]